MDQIDVNFQDFSKEEKEFICRNASLMLKNEKLQSFIEKEMLPNYKDNPDEKSLNQLFYYYLKNSSAKKQGEFFKNYILKDLSFFFQF